MSEPEGRPPVVDPDEGRPPVVGPDEGAPGVAEPSAADERSVWENVRDVFVAPARTFRDARRSPRVLPPLIVVVAAASLVVAGVLVALGPPDAMDRVLEESGIPGGSFMKVAVVSTSVVAVAIGTPLAAALVGGLLWAWSTVRDGVSTFTVAFVAALYVEVLEPVEALVDALAAEAVGRGLDAVTLGPTLFLRPDAVSPALYGALAHVSLFSIWSAILVGVAGVHAMRLSRQDAAIFAVALWFVGLAIAAVAGVAGGFEAPSTPSAPSL